MRTVLLYCFLLYGEAFLLACDFVTDLRNFSDAVVCLADVDHSLSEKWQRINTMFFPKFVVENDVDGNLLKDQLLFCSQKGDINLPSGWC